MTTSRMTPAPTMGQKSGKKDDKAEMIKIIITLVYAKKKKEKEEKMQNLVTKLGGMSKEDATTQLKGAKKWANKHLKKLDAKKQANGGKEGPMANLKRAGLNKINQTINKIGKNLNLDLGAKKGMQNQPKAGAGAKMPTPSPGGGKGGGGAKELLSKGGPKGQAVSMAMDKGGGDLKAGADKKPTPSPGGGKGGDGAKELLSKGGPKGQALSMAMDKADSKKGDPPGKEPGMGGQGMDARRSSLQQSAQPGGGSGGPSQQKPQGMQSKTPSPSQLNTSKGPGNKLMPKPPSAKPT